MELTRGARRTEHGFYPDTRTHARTRPHAHAHRRCPYRTKHTLIVYTQSDGSCASDGFSSRKCRFISSNRTGRAGHAPAQPDRSRAPAQRESPRSHPTVSAVWRLCAAPELKSAPPEIKPAPPELKPAPPKLKPAPPELKPAPIRTHALLVRAPAGSAAACLQSRTGPVRAELERAAGGPRLNTACTEAHQRAPRYGCTRGASSLQGRPPQSRCTPRNSRARRR
jgi:hypothetical protein